MSFTASLPIALLSEAMSCGLCIMSSALSGAAESLTVRIPLAMCREMV